MSRDGLLPRGMAKVDEKQVAIWAAETEMAADGTRSRPCGPGVTFPRRSPGDDSVPTRRNMANLLFTMGRLEEAARNLQEAVRIDPNDPLLYLASGRMLLELKDFANAARMFRAAVRIDNNAYQAFNLLGVALIAQGYTAEAIYNFGRALDLKPDYAPAKQNLEAARRQRDGLVSPATTRTSM